MSQGPAQPRPAVRIEALIPGGILATDRWHVFKDDGSCSRCGREPPEDDVPLLLWKNDGHWMLRYCERCLGRRRDDDDVDEEPTP